MIIDIPYDPRPVQKKIHWEIMNHRFSVIVAHRRSGKTVAMINHLIRAATECDKERPRYAYIAPLYSQAKGISWDYLKHYTANFPKVRVNESELWVEFPGRKGPARIRLYGSDNPDTLRGLYFDGVVIDEVAQCKPNLWGEIVRPTLMDRKGWCAFIGTPKGMNVFFELYNKALRDPKWYGGIFPVTATNVLSEEELAEAKRDMTDAQYRQEMLCDFSASSEDILIPLDLIMKAVKRNNLPQTYTWAPIVIGVDVARFGDDASVICVRQGNHLIQMKSYREMNLMTFSDAVAGMITRYNAVMCFVDVVGLGSGVVDRLIQLGFNNVMGINAGYAPDNTKYKNKRAEMWDTMKKWIEDGGDLPDDPILIAQLSSVQYTFDPTDRLVLEKKEDMRKRGVPSPDRAEALAHSFFMPVMAQDWDEEVGGFTDMRMMSPPNAMTGY